MNGTLTVGSVYSKFFVAKNTKFWNKIKMKNYERHYDTLTHMHTSSFINTKSKERLDNISKINSLLSLNNT